MAEQNQTDDPKVYEGGIENIIQEVESGEEVEGEHPDQVYQYRQRIVSPDSAPDVLTGEQQPASDESPEALPPPETS